MLHDFIDRYPKISLQISEDDRLVNLVKEGIDCALRAGSLQDSSLIAKPLAKMEQITVASPQYIEKHGKPITLDELKDHRCIAYMSSSAGQDTCLDFTIGDAIKSIS